MTGPVTGQSDVSLPRPTSVRSRFDVIVTNRSFLGVLDSRADLAGFFWSEAWKGRQQDANVPGVWVHAETLV